MGRKSREEQSGGETIGKSISDPSGDIKETAG